MLLLYNSNHLYFALILQAFGQFVPSWHVRAAAGSPGGKDVQDDLLAAKVRNGRGPPIQQLWKYYVRKLLSYLKSKISRTGVGRLGVSRTYGRQTCDDSDTDNAARKPFSHLILYGARIL